MTRPCALLLSPGECEALLLFLARHRPVWRVVAHEFALVPEELEARIVEAHRAGIALNEAAKE